MNHTNPKDTSKKTRESLFAVPEKDRDEAWYNAATQYARNLKNRVSLESLIKSHG